FVDFGTVIGPAAALVLLLLQSFEPVSARDEDICRLFSNNTVIRDPDSCSKSITCIDFVSHYSTCSGDTPFFNKDTAKCVKSLSDKSSCSISCSQSATQFLADPKSCYGYYYCQDQETALYGTCPQDTHFNATTQTCTRQHESACTTSSFEYCYIVKDGVNFDNRQGCDQYHVCSKGSLQSKTCSGQYYQASTGECQNKALVECEAHPLPKDVCGTVKSPKANKFIADGATCRGYFYCAKQQDGTPDPNPRWNQCPEDRFFDAKTETCRLANQVSCTADRCDGRTLDFVVSSSKGCRNYLRCSNGVTLDEKSCGNLFFDEEKGSCVQQITKYPVCT
ncbi:hypothetical protein KR074_002285, partial [Drosophila pseudoananassae]